MGYHCPVSSDGQLILSPREFQTMVLLCQGVKPKEICSRFGLNDNSLRTYVSRSKQKLRCRTLIQAAIKFKTFYEPRYAGIYTHRHIKHRIHKDEASWSLSV